MSEPIHHEESLSSAAIDGARISVLIASNIVCGDPEISPELKGELIAAFTDAMMALEFIRHRFPVITTSVHIVPG